MVMGNAVGGGRKEKGGKKGRDGVGVSEEKEKKENEMEKKTEWKEIFEGIVKLVEKEGRHVRI